MGNIAVGGTGKTPFSAFLIEKIGAGAKVAWLSRGYRRKSKGFKFISKNTSVFEAGDEPKLMKLKFTELTVAVDGNRVEGVSRILQQYPETELIILDDGFQHRRINPGMKIVLTDYKRIFTRDFLMPYGYLRENKSAYKRADIIVVTKCPNDLSTENFISIEREIKLKTGQKLFFSALVYDGLYTLFGDSELSFEALKSKMAIFMTGIASPEHAVNYLASQQINVELLNFPDHHFFTVADYKKLLNKVAENRIIIVTEKDAVRIQADENYPESLKNRTYVLPVKIKILNNEEKTLITIIKNYVGTN